MIKKIRNKYKRRNSLPLMVLIVLGMFSITTVASASRYIVKNAGKSRNVKTTAAGSYIALFDTDNEQRVRFAADHGVADPAALVEAVRHSQMANLLISVAIEESHGDPVAVGSAGERGAWQVKTSHWGSVPKDIHGQAGQAEKIIRSLLDYAKGDKKKALARYNGGITPPEKSYRYAERVLKRTMNLQAALNYIPASYNSLRAAMLGPPRNSRILTSFFQSGIAKTET